MRGKIDLDSLVILSLSDERKQVLNKFVENGDFPTTAQAGAKILIAFIEMIKQDFVRIEFKGPNCEVFVKGLDY